MEYLKLETDATPALPLRLDAPVRRNFMDALELARLLLPARCLPKLSVEGGSAVVLECAGRVQRRRRFGG